MNILILHGTSDLYGGSKIIYTVAEFLKKKHKVTVVLSEEGPLAELLRNRKIEVLIIKLGILRRKYFTPLGILNRIKVLHRARKDLKKVIAARDIDLIYSNTTGVLVGAYVAKSCNLKHVWHIHEIIIKPQIFSKFIGWHVNMFSDLVIVVSKEVEKHWAKHINERSKVKTIYNGIDYKPFLNCNTDVRNELNIASDCVIVGMVGRVNLWKGQKYFLEMAEKVAQRHSNVKFIMVGDAYPGYEYLYDEIGTFIKECNLDGKVLNLGYRTDIAAILSALDIFISPSILPDPFPTVILEAMACSIPVIATNHGGSIEMVDDGDTGFLIPTDNVQAAVNKILQLIENSCLRLKMGKAGRNKVLSNYSLDAFESNVLNYIEQL